MSEGKRTTRRVPYICELRYGPPEEPPKLRVCLAGPAGSGKTSLLGRWRGFGLSDLSTHPTCGANYTVFVRKNKHGDDYTENVWDTAGQETYASLLPFYMRSADVAVLVFEIEKFNAADFELWLEKLSCCEEGTRLVVVCNKSDLVDSNLGALRTFDECREILSKDLERRFVLLGMFVTSCRTGSCCEETHTCITEYLGTLVRSKHKGETKVTRTGTAEDASTQTEKGCC